MIDDELEYGLRLLLGYVQTKTNPSRAYVASQIRYMHRMLVANDKCAYCGNPKHPGIHPEPISRAEAKKLWDERNRSIRALPELKLTAGQCETIKKCWDKLGGDYSYMAAFTAIMKKGSAKILGA